MSLDANQVLLMICLLAFGCSFATEWVQMEPDVQLFHSANWKRERPILAHEDIHAVFVLRHDSHKMESFEKTLLERTTPEHPMYGRWMEIAEVIEAVSPPQDNVQVVVNYLITGDVDVHNIRVSPLGDKLHVQMSALQASKLLNTEFGIFRSISHNHISLPRIIRPYFLPSDVAAVTELVDDILRFPSLRRPHFVYHNVYDHYRWINSFRKKDDDEDDTTTDDDDKEDKLFACDNKCQGLTTPAVLQKAYKFNRLKSSAKGNSMAVAEFQLQYYDDKDLKVFSQFCNANVTVDDTIGGNVESICLITGCVEALLDIEYIKAVAAPIPLTVIYSFKFSLIDWIDKVLSMKNPPLVHSVSYGNDEAQQTSIAYMFAVNQQLMKAAARGLSIVFAAGDQGVWGRTGFNRNFTFNPDFPASSPYVLSVGGTDFQQKSHIGKETAWSCGGGGFSNTFERPSWQDKMVASYLKNASDSNQLPKSTSFNASGRGYPDVSALGGQVNPYCVSVRGGTFRGVSGTSASAPVVAGLIAQLNNIRLEKHRPPLGLITPFLYQHLECFNDIEDASQNNCLPLTTGFSALSGWDPATGLGTPNFECLAKKVNNLD